MHLAVAREVKEKRVSNAIQTEKDFVNCDAMESINLLVESFKKYI